MAALCVAAVASSANAQGLNFQAFPGPGFTGSFPPDPAIAVGPNVVIVGVNGQIAAYEKNGTLRWRVPEEQFFQNLSNLGFNPTNGYSDPKLVFDVDSQKFFYVILGLDGDNQASTRFMIAVSQTSDPQNPNQYTLDNPQGGWLKFTATAIVNGAWGDYPSIAVDKNALYVSANYFSATTGQNVGTHLRIYPKGQFSNFNPPAQLQQFLQTNIQTAAGGGAGTLQPTNNLSNNADIQYFVSAGDFSSRNNIYVYQVNGAASPNVMRRYSVPIANGATGAYDQSGNVTARDSGEIDSLDLRIYNAVRYNDSIYCSHNVRNPDSGTTMIRWYKINIDSPTAVSLADQGVIRNFNGSAWLPGICVNPAGDVVVAHSRAGPTEYPSLYYSWRLGSDPASQMQPAVRVQAGLGGYQGFRWGDYCTPALDPADMSTIWALHMFADANGTWETRFFSVPLTFGDGNGGGPPPAPCPTVIEVPAPKNRENWVNGSTRQITWTFAGNGEDPVDVLLAKRDVIVGTIAQEVAAGDGALNWQVGKVIEDVEILPADDYRIVVRPTFCDDADRIQLSNGFFSVTSRVVANAAPPGSIDPGEGVTKFIEIAAGESVKLGAVDVDGKSMTATKGKGPYTYKWSPGDFLDSATDALPTSTPLFTTTYTVEVRDTTGTVATDSIQVVIGDPLRADAGKTRAFRNGGTVILEGSARGGTPPYFYEWSPIPDKTLGEGLDGVTEPQPKARPDGPTVYTLKVTDSLGAVSSDTVSVIPGLAFAIINNPGNGGVVERDIVQDLYMTGDEVAIEAVARPGFVFSNWATPSEEFVNRPANPAVPFTENPTLIRMLDKDLSIEAIYVPLTPGGGAGSPLPSLCGTMSLTAIGGTLIGMILIRRRTRRQIGR